MCQLKKLFKRKLKAWRRNERQKFCDRLGNDIERGDCKTFWQNVKFGQSQYRVSPTKRVRPEESDDEEMNAWKQHFGGIINSEPDSKIEQECKVFEETLQFHLGKLKLPWWVVDVNVWEVEQAECRLKWKKSAGVDQVQAEHLKHGGRSLVIHTSVAFMAFCDTPLYLNNG